MITTDQAVNEKDVENQYRQALLREVANGKITSPHNTDGVLQAETLFVLLEFKYDYDLKKRADVAKVLSQCLVYLKSFEVEDGNLPSSLFVGDIDECFVMPTKHLSRYLEKKIDWSSITPSSAWKELPSVYRELATDSSIQPYVLDTETRESFVEEVISRCESIHEGSVHKVPVTVQNLSGIFASWKEQVLRNGASPEESVNGFLQSILDNAYVHPKKPLLVNGNAELEINREAHNQFFNWFQREYKVTEQRKFTEIKDRLLEEETRRRSGDFYTPSVWAHEAHRTLDQELGPDWRDEYIVWDCSAGTANLTRDYQFEHLYLSTLYKSDVQTIEDMDYHTGRKGEAFQFDFLNDPLSEAPERLQRAIADGEPILFLNNPPFGTASAEAKGGANKEGVSFTSIKDQMDVGRAANQLYAQFMWRMSNMTESHDDAVIGLYSKPLFMTGYSFRKFREYFYNRWEFNDGFLFRADEFNGTSDQWGVSFTVWNKGEEDDQSFDLSLKRRDEHGLITNGRRKKFWYPKETASSWVNPPRDLWWGKSDQKVPNLSSAVRWKDGYQGVVPGQIGFMVNDTNRVEKNQQSVILQSWSSSMKTGKAYVLPENWNRCIALFCARKSIKGNWINDKDEYCAPNESHPDYDQWVRDAHVYSLFNPSSQQSSLRDIEYKGDSWDITNEFFWLESSRVKELANQHGFTELYNDANLASEERYMQKQLQGMELSEDAQWLLEESISLVEDSMPLREQQAREHPEMHLEAWDASWYQIRKGILEDLFPDRYDRFVQRYRDFEDRMREGVYTFGFLKDQ